MVLILFSLYGYHKKEAHVYRPQDINRILDVLEDERPKIICIDELEKMGFQNQLLNFMES
jgi:hypothetical protein